MDKTVVEQDPDELAAISAQLGLDEPISPEEKP
jgi:hypothetical protein